MELRHLLTFRAVLREGSFLKAARALRLAQPTVTLHIQELEADFRRGLDAVANLDEDRILRRYLRLVLATLRTNYYQRGPDGAPYNPYLSLKIDPAAVPEMPLPLPAYEIFVYSPRTEGVHLRGGKVARGGIRASDRREDFRTEVLGLMKAQMVKNCVIVPVGATSKDRVVTSCGTYEIRSRWAKPWR